MITYIRNKPFPNCRSCGLPMGYWVPGLSDEAHEHSECVGRRIAREILQRLTPRTADVLVRCQKCNALIETTVHCDVCGTFEPTRR